MKHQRIADVWIRAYNCAYHSANTSVFIDSRLVSNERELSICVSHVDKSWLFISVENFNKERCGNLVKTLSLIGVKASIC